MIIKTVQKHPNMQLQETCDQYLQHYPKNDFKFVIVQSHFGLSVSVHNNTKMELGV